MPTKYNVPTIEELISAGVHFGHQVKRWHPSMEKYIYTAKRNIHIIDLEETEKLLKEAADFLYQLAKDGKKVIFVGTKKQARDIIENEAKNAGAMYVTERWLGGTITNFEIIKKNNIDKMIDLKSKMEKGEFDHYTKKERLLIDREIERLERYVGGLAEMKKMPDVLVVVDSRREKTAIREAIRAKIPVIALIDTNADPKGIDYPIPVNDDAIKSIAIVVKTLAAALIAGTKDYGEASKEKETKEETKEEKLGKEKEEKKDENEKQEKKTKKTVKKTTDNKKEDKKTKTETKTKKRGRPKKK